VSEAEFRTMLAATPPAGAAANVAGQGQMELL